MATPQPETAAAEGGEMKAEKADIKDSPREFHQQNAGMRRGRGGGRFMGRRQPSGGMPNENGNERKRLFPNRFGNPRGGPHGNMPRSLDDRIMEKVAQICGPSYELPPVSHEEKKFSNKSRLYVGNLPNDITDDEINGMFQKFGETNELFVNRDKNFAFIRLDYYVNAVKAKHELDAFFIKNRNLKIRFAPLGTSIKVKNLTPMVSNELLYVAFSVFGEIEKCLVCVDNRGKPTGEGIVEYVRKNCAQLALRKCKEECFFITASLRPAIAEPYDIVEDSDGYPDKNVNKKSNEFTSEREVGPRFALPNSFEYEYGMRWKQLHELQSQKMDALKSEFLHEMEKLEMQMEQARYDQETEMLREKLRSRELNRERHQKEFEMKEKQVEQSKMQSEDQIRRQQEELQQKMSYQEKEMQRRQQENYLFMQAHQLDNMLEQEEQAADPPSLFNTGGQDGGFAGNKRPMDPKAFMYDRNFHFEGRGPPRGGNAGGRGYWVNENRGGPGSANADFPNKRRRF